VDDYGDWWSRGVVVTDANGHARLPFKLAVSKTVRAAVMDGYDTLAGSDEFLVKPGVSVGKPKPSTAPTVRGRWVKWTGTLQPEHEYAERAVQLRVQKLVKSKWVTQQTVPTMMEYSRDYWLVYAGRARVTTAGKYRITAYHPEDDDNLAGSSSSYYFNVK